MQTEQRHLWPIQTVLFAILKFDNFFPCFVDILRAVVGEEDYTFAIKELVEALQYEKLNRYDTCFNEDSSLL